MLLKIKNIGPIHEASIDLTKRMVLFTGHNNTGKTYLSYLIFLISRGNFFQNYATNYFKNEINTAFELGEVEFNLEEILDREYENLFSIINGELKKNISPLFANKTLFKDSEIDIRWASKIEYMEFIKNKYITWRLAYASTNVFVEKVTGSFKMKLSVGAIGEQRQTTTQAYQTAIINSVQRILLSNLSEYIPRSTQFMAAERIGIAIFSKDISINKAKAFDEIVVGIDKQKLLNTISRQFNSYPTPIQESIIAQETSINYKDQISDFADIGEEIEEKILNGKINISKDGEMEVILRDRKSISLSLSGSGIKSLSALTFYLKHKAQKGQVIIIDEPEINLHPDNQIKIARILIKIVNRGIKIIMSTHSDYIIREFSNLLMLGSHQNTIAYQLMERHGYSDSEILSPENIAAYFMSKGIEGFTEISSIKLEFGEIVVKSFSDTINRQNVISDDIFFSLNSSNDTDNGNT